jgi:hypothetical protein
MPDTHTPIPDFADHVVQRLFAIGLGMQGTIARVQSPEILQRLAESVDDLQGVIDDIRGATFPPCASRIPLCQRLDN